MANSCCSICLDPFVCPAACVPCGHVFCYCCISQWNQALFGGSHCPHCRHPINAIQRLVVEEGNIYFGSNAPSDRIRSYVKQQWSGMYETAAEKLRIMPTYIHEVLTLSGDHLFRRYMQNYRTYARRLRHFPTNVKRGWNSLGSELQILLVFVIVLVVALAIQDVQNPLGLWKGCLLPLLCLFKNMLQEVLSCILLILCRPVVCIVHCFLEVNYALWDIMCGIFFMFVMIGWNVIMVPCVIVSAIVEWTFIVVSFASEVVVTFVRFVFVILLVSVPVLLLQSNEAQRNNALDKLQTLFHQAKERFRNTLDTH